jgi:hypothetical protein
MIAILPLGLFLIAARSTQPRTVFFQQTECHAARLLSFIM